VRKGARRRNEGREVRGEGEGRGFRAELEGGAQGRGAGAQTMRTHKIQREVQKGGRLPGQRGAADACPEPCGEEEGTQVPLLIWSKRRRRRKRKREVSQGARGARMGSLSPVGQEKGTQVPF